MKKILLVFCVVVLILGLSVNALAGNDTDGVAFVTITNCDTGKSISEDELSQFLYHDQGDGRFTLTSIRGGYYVDFTQGGLKESWYEIVYTVKELENNRVQIVMEDGSLLADSGKKKSCAESLELYAADSTALETGWYITEDIGPVKILPLGDSLTFGTNPDDTENDPVGYREKLSGYLLDYFNMLCFVGPQNTPTLLTDKFLLRHAGYPGYVIEDVYGDDLHPGINTLVPEIMEEYTPDIVVLMIGTNDCTMLAGSLDMDSDMAALADRWKALIKQIDEKLPDDGMVICCSIPPLLGGRDELLNEKIKSGVEALKEEEIKVSFADVYSLFENNDDYLSSDGAHLSNKGYSAVAEYLCKFIALEYGRNGVKGEGMEVTFEEVEPPEESKVEESKVEEKPSEPESTVEPETQPVPEGKEQIFFILVGVIALMVIAIIILLILKRKSK